VPNPDAKALAKLGISLIDPEVAPEAYAELLRVARRIRESRRQLIGLLPASPRVAVPAVAIQLAAVLCDVSAGPVVFVDANTRWPALESLRADSAGTSSTVVRLTLRDGVVAVTHANDRPDRIDIAWLQDTLERCADEFNLVLVDFTGFPLMGEHASAFDLVDAVLIVARAGLTREKELLARNAEVPAARRLGVLLSG